MAKTVEITFAIGAALAGSFMGTFGKAGKALSDFQKQAEDLQKVSGQIETYQKMQNSMMSDQVSATLMREQAQSYSDQAAASKSHTQELSTQYKTAQQEVERLAAANIRNSDAYKAAQLNVKSLANQIQASTKPTEELQKQYKAAQEEVRRLEGVMKHGSSALKATQVHAQQLKAEMKQSSAETKSLSNKSKELTASADKLQSKLDRDKEALSRLRTELTAAGVDTKNLANEQARLTQQSQRMAEAQARLQSSRAALQQTRQNLSLSNIKGELLTAAGLGYSLYKPVSQAADFESAMARVNAVAFSGAGRDKEADAKSLKALEAQARQLGRDTQFTATQAAQSQENLARAGFKSNEIISAMPGLLNMAAAEGMDLATASDIAASTLRGFKLSADQSSRVADVLAQTSAASNTNIVGLGEGMKYVAPVAANLGVSLEETAAMLGVMANAGIKGTEGGTALRGAFLRLAQEPKAVAEALEGMGIASRDAKGNMRQLPDIMSELSVKMKDMGEAEKVKNLANIFGVRAVSGMMAVMNSVLDGSFEQLYQYNKEATGVLQAMSETVGVSLDDMRSAMKDLDPLADRLGISFRDLSIYTAMLAENGIKGVTANHLLSTTLSQLANNSKQVQAGLKKYNISLVGDDGTMRNMPDLLNDINNAIKGMTDAQQLEELIKIFGDDAALAIRELINSGSFGGLVETATGAVQAMAEAVGVNIDDIRAGMKGLDPLADKLGISFRDLSIYTAMLAKSGIKGATANHLLTTTFSQLAENSQQVQAGLKQYDISLIGDDGKMRDMPDLLNDINNAMKGMTDAQQLEALTKIFGSDAALGVRALMKEINNGTFTELDQLPNKAKGVSQEMVEKLLNTYTGQATIMKSAIESLTIDIGKVLLPVSKEVIKTFSGWIAGLSSLAQKYPLVTKAIVGGVAALSAYKVGIVGLKIGWNLTKLPFQHAHVALDWLNAKLISQGEVSLWAAAKTKVMTAASKSWQLAMKAGGKLLNVGKLALYYSKQLVISAATKAWTAAQWLWNAAMNANPILLIITAIGLAITAGYLLYKNWDKIKEWWNSWTIDDVFAVIKDYANRAWTYVVEKWNEFWNWWDSISLSDFFAPIKDYAGKAKDYIIQELQEFSEWWSTLSLSDLFEPVKDYALEAWNYVKGKWQEFSDWWNSWSLGDIFPESLSISWDDVIVGWENAKSLLISGWNNLVGEFHIDFSGIWDTLSSGFSIVCESIKGAWESVTGFIKDAWDTASDYVSGAWKWTKGLFGFDVEGEELKAQLEDITVLNKMSEGFSQRVAEMTAAWQPFKSLLGEGFQEIYTVMQSISDKIRSIVIPAVSELVSALSRVATEITSIVQAGNLEVQVSVPSQGIGSNIPSQSIRTFGGRKRAEGGIITQPEIALIGEAGREAIIPLEKQTRGADLWFEAGRELGLIPASSVINQETIQNYNVMSQVVKALKIQPEISSIAPHAMGGIFSQPHVGLVAEAGREAIIPLENQVRGTQLWFEAGRELGIFQDDTHDSSLGIPLWKAADESTDISFGTPVSNKNTQVVFSPNFTITVNGGDSDSEQKYRQMFTEIFEDLVTEYQSKMQRVAFE